MCTRREEEGLETLDTPLDHGPTRSHHTVTVTVRSSTHRDRETTVRPRHPADWHKVDWRSRLNAGLAGALDYLEVHGIGTALGEPN